MNFVRRIKNVFTSIKNSFKRFPITIGVSTILVIMLIILSEKGPHLSTDTREAFRRSNMIIALGIPVSLCIKLIYEKRKELKKAHEVLGYILGTGILVLYYFFLLKDFNMMSIVRYMGVTLFLYLAFLYIPWLGNKGDFEFYIIKVLSSFFLTLIYSFVLYFGVSAILFTIDQLFNANIPGKYFYYIFLIVAGIFAPSLFLARIPNVDQDFDKYEYPKSLKVLLLYIVMPLITVYSIILYAYFGKIIITQNWPKGLVSHLVLWYSVLSVAVIFFITPILDENKWANKFKFWFPKLIIPILIMMFISMGIRIKTYGITENRYFVVVLGLWVLGIMLYFAMRKKQNNTIILISLSIIALNAVFGPMSSFSISKLSQNNRLKSILVRNNILVDGKVIKASESIAAEDKSETSMILRYFDTYHSLEDVKYLPKDFEISDMETVFGFPFMGKDTFGNDYFSYHSKQEGSVFEIQGYDYFLESYAIMGRNVIYDDVEVFYDREDFDFKIKHKNNILYKTNLKTHGINIIEKHKDDYSLGLDEMTFVDENDKVKVKFIITNMSGQRDGFSGDKIINYMDYYVLIKIK